MAAAVNVRTFWGALLSVLLKCIAALGFATPASRTATAARVETPVAAGTGAAELATAGTGVPTPRIEATPKIPAPRGYEPLRSERERTLPPTMKQRIHAEAHGSSPSARSIRGDLAEEIAAPVALAEAATGATGKPAAARPASIHPAPTHPAPTHPASTHPVPARPVSAHSAPAPSGQAGQARTAPVGPARPAGDDGRAATASVRPTAGRSAARFIRSAVSAPPVPAANG